MKKLLNKTITAATLCMFAAMLFTANVFAQDGNKLIVAPETTCAYVPVGVNQTVTCGGSILMGENPTTCHGAGWNDPGCGSPLCFTIDAYSWSPSTDLTSTTIAQPRLNDACDAVGNQIYTLTITVGLAHYSSTVTIHHTGCCSGCCRIGNFNSHNEVQYEGVNVFPNPSSGNVTVAFDILNANTSIEVYNMDGKLVMKKANVADKTVELNLSSIAKGAYFIQVLSGDKGIVNKKILIQ